MVAFDYEGHLLRHPRPDTLTPANVAGDLLAVADVVRADRFAYYGYSLLALSGLQLALRTDRLSALVMGGFPPIDGPYTEMLRVTTAAHDMSRSPRPAPQPPQPTEAPEAFDWSSVEVSMTEPQTRQFVTLYQALRGFDDRAAQAQVTCPRLCFAGSADEIEYGEKWGGFAVADTDGIAGLSMRAVGKQFGCTAMALYTYVPTKSELLDLMYDRVHAEFPVHPGQGWRAAVTSWADDLWALYLRHPWVPHVSYARPVLGPNEQAVLEDLVRILYQTGLPARVVRRIVSVLFHLVRGTAQTVAESRMAATATGMSDQEWWSTRSAQLREVAPDFTQRFPMSARLACEASAQPEDESAPYLEHEAKETFAVGLTVLLDWIETTTAKASTRRYAAPPAGDPC